MQSYKGNLTMVPLYLHLPLQLFIVDFLIPLYYLKCGSQTGSLYPGERVVSWLYRWLPDGWSPRSTLVLSCIVRGDVSARE